MKQLWLLIVITGFLLFNIAGISAKNANDKTVKKDSKYVLRGVVTDRFTGEALAGVSVNLNETGNVVYTDFDGNFKFDDVKPGAYNLTLSYISYRNKTAKGVETNISEKKPLEIKMSKQ